ncbi:MAG: alpha/beta hydrolase [Desulfobacteraceae bacterium]|nr:alpha/beta hydrolase [Desulfobacteraceae bacterium]
MNHKKLYFNTTMGRAFGLYANNDKHILIVFLHGAGDSHLNYVNFLNYNELLVYDIFIPDIMGYGYSNCEKLSFSFDQQVDVLVQQIRQLPSKYKTIILVPHSMGGIHAVLLANGKLASSIRGIYAIETTLTQYGSFISRQILKCFQKGENLSEWFDRWSDQIYQAGLKESALGIYHVGLQLTTIRCFTQNCMAMRQLAVKVANAEFTNCIGYDFVKLSLPKVYCIAQNGQQLQSLPFLKAYHVPVHILPSSSHFCAQGCPEQFLKNLNLWIQNLILNL